MSLLSSSLSAEENRLVADYLEQHPEYQSEVRLIQQLQTNRDSEPEIPAPDTQRLLAKLDAALEQQAAPSGLQQWLQKLLAPPHLWAAVPAVLVLALVLLWIPQQGTHDPDYQTLSSGEEDSNLQLSVMTRLDASVTTVLPLLQQAVPNASITTLEDGYYRVTLNTVMPPDAVLQIMQTIQAIDLVQEVEILTE